MRASIYVKFYGPTNFKGARWGMRDFSGKLRFARYHYDKDFPKNVYAAVKEIFPNATPVEILQPLGLQNGYVVIVNFDRENK